MRALLLALLAWPLEEVPPRPAETRVPACATALREARARLARRDLEGALEQARAAAAADPACAAAHLLRAGIHASRGEIDAALVLYDERVRQAGAQPPLDRREEDIRAGLEAGRLSRGLRDEPGARRRLSDALRLDPQDRFRLHGEIRSELALAFALGKDAPSAALAGAMAGATRASWKPLPDDDPTPVLREEFVLLDPPVEDSAEPPLPPYAAVAPVPLRAAETGGLADFPVGALARSPGGQVVVFARDSAAALHLVPGQAPARQDFPGSPAPVALAESTPTGWWVVPRGLPLLLELDGQGREKRRISLESEPSALALHPSRALAFVAVQRRLQVVDLADGAVTSTALPAERLAVHDASGRLLLASALVRGDEGESGWPGLHHALRLRGESIRKVPQSLVCLASVDDWGGVSALALRLRGPPEPRALALAPDGLRLLVCAPVAPARVLAAPRLSVVARPAGVAEAAAFDPSSHRLALSGPGGIRVVPPDGVGDPVALPGQPAAALLWSQDGSRLASLRADGRVDLFGFPEDPARVARARLGADAAARRLAGAGALAARRHAPPSPLETPAPRQESLASFTPTASLDAALASARQALADHNPRRISLPEWFHTGEYGRPGQPDHDRLIEARDALCSLPAGVLLHRLRDAPDSPPAALLRASARLRLGERSQSVPLLLSAVRGDAGRTSVTAQGLLGLAHALQGENREAEALDCAAAVLRLCPWNCEVSCALEPLLRKHDLPVPRVPADPDAPPAAPSPPPPLLTLPPPDPDAPRLDAGGVYALAVPVTVRVEGDTGSGSGVFLSADGHVATSFHVVDPPTQHLRVRVFSLRDGVLARGRALPATVVFWSREDDFALLKVDEVPDGLRPPPLLTADPPAGAAVFAVGSPGHWRGDLEQSITDGIVSAPRRALGDGLPVLQHSAAVRPGNSGGPLFTDRGGLAGLNARRSWFDDAGFALPASRIRELLQPAKANP